MPDTTIDRLTIEIDAEAQNANNAVDDLAEKIGKLVQSFTTLNGIKTSNINNVQKQVKNISLSTEEIIDKYKDLGKDFQFFGGMKAANKKVDSLSNALETAKIKKQELELAGKTKGVMYENSIRDTIKYQNQIENLKKYLETLSQTSSNTKYHLKQSTITLQDFEETLKKFDLYASSSDKKTETELSSYVRGLELSLEQLKNLYPEAEEMITRYEAEIEYLKEIMPDASYVDYGNIDLSPLEEKIPDTSEKIKELASLLEQLEVPEIREENLDKLRKNIEKTEAKLEELRIKLTNELTMGNIEESVDDKRYVRLQEQIALTEKYLEALKNKTEEVEKQSRATSLEKFKNALLGMAEAGKKAVKTFSNVWKNLSNLRKTLDGAAKKIVSFSKSLLGIKKSSKGLNNSFSSGLKNILAYGFGIRTLYTLFNKLRNAIKDGIKNLVQFSSETNASVSLLNNSLNQLKNATAAAVSPLLNALAPALNTIIQWCVSATNAVNQLFSALTGKSTWIKAKTLTDDYASSLDKANGSTEKLYNTTLGIDELNINSGDESSSSSSGTDASDMFEYEELSEKWANIADWIKKMWEEADFTELGALLGEKLKNALENIEWAPIQETARKIGTSIATLINGFVETEGLGYTIGETLGNAINTGVQGINAFLDNTHWDSVGIFLGEGANGLVDSINFEDIGHMIAQRFNAIFETLENAFATFDWKNLGVKLSELITTFIKDIDVTHFGGAISENIKGVLDLIIGFVEETDWQDLGATVYQKVKDFIISIDWTGIADRLFEAIGAVLGGLAGFLWGIIQSAWNDVITWWYDAAYEDGEFTMEGLLSGIWEKIKDIGNWIVEHIYEPFMNGFKEAFGIHSPSTVMEEMGQFIIEGLWNGIKGAWSWLTDSIKSFCDNFVGKFKDFLGIHSPSKVFEENGEYVVEGFNQGILKSDSKSSVSLWIESIKQSFAPEIWEPVFANIGETFKSVWFELIDWWNNEAIVSFMEGSVIPYFGYDYWYSLFQNGFFLAYFEIWLNFSDSWTANLTIWKKTNEELYFGEKVWLKNWMNLYNAYNKVWKEFFELWVENFTYWWNEYIVPYFSEEQWTEFGQNMKNGIYGGFKSIVGDITRVLNAIIGVFDSAFSKLESSMNKLIRDYNKAASEMGTPKLSTVSYVKMGKIDIPAFSTGGVVEDGLFLANHNELIGKFNNGKTAVANNEQITTGIENGVERAVSRVLAPYLEEIAQNTREAADKDFDVSLDGRSLLEGLKQRSVRNGYSFT